MGTTCGKQDSQEICAIAITNKLIPIQSQAFARTARQFKDFSVNLHLGRSLRTTMQATLPRMNKQHFTACRGDGRREDWSFCRTQ